MNIEQLKSALKPELHKITLQSGVELYAHRPTLSDYEKCSTVKATLVLCVTDATGYHVFADGEESGKIDINELDAVVANEVFMAVIKLYESASPQDEVEKK